MSNKALFVMEMPENCEECPFCDFVDYTCGVFGIIGKNFTYEIPEDGVADWCPLKPVPEKKKVIRTPVLLSDFERRGRQKGWNACIDAITGDAE